MARAAASTKATKGTKTKKKASATKPKTTVAGKAQPKKKSASAAKTALAGVKKKKTVAKAAPKKTTTAKKAAPKKTTTAKKAVPKAKAKPTPKAKPKTKPAPKSKATPQTKAKAAPQAKTKAAPQAKTGKAPKKTAKAAAAKAPKKNLAAANGADHAHDDHASFDLQADVETTPIPQIGDDAPGFSLATDDGKTISLDDYYGRNHIVLYFYPKDDTPGCTKQACAFQSDLSQFQTHDTIVIGVSPDDATSHAKFRAKYGLGFPLAIDTDAEVAKAYGVWVKKNLYGRQYMGIERSTFLIAKDGTIAAVWPKVKVEGHSGEVLSAIAALGAGMGEHDEDSDEQDDEPRAKAKADDDEDEDDDQDEAEGVDDHAYEHDDQDDIDNEG